MAPIPGLLRALAGKLLFLSGVRRPGRCLWCDAGRKPGGADAPGEDGSALCRCSPGAPHLRFAPRRVLLQCEYARMLPLRFRDYAAASADDRYSLRGFEFP